MRAIFEQLWRHPSKRAYAGRCGDSHAQRMVAQHTCEPKVCDPCREIPIDQNVVLWAISRDRTVEGPNLRLSNLREQTASHGDTSVRERHLPATRVRSGWSLLQVFGRMLTSFSRFVPGCATMKSTIVPFSIHSETIIKVSEDLVAPSSGNRFGCLNCFHNTTSWQNFCLTLVSTSANETEIHRESYPFHIGVAWTVVNPFDCDLGTSVPSAKHIGATTTPAWGFFNPL